MQLLLQNTESTKLSVWIFPGPIQKPDPRVAEPPNSLYWPDYDTTAGNRLDVLATHYVWPEVAWFWGPNARRLLFPGHAARCSPAINRCAALVTPSSLRGKRGAGDMARQNRS